MRKPLYISPSSFFSFTQDPIKHYVRHYSDTPAGRQPATIHMAMGSAFDAFVKAQITRDLQVSTKFDLITLYEEQVPEEFREELWPKAAFLLEEYKSCGAYGVAVEDMSLANLEPRFEFDVKAKILGVPIFGKPDAFYHNRRDVPVILDWKVNSFLGGRNAKKAWYVMDHQNGCSHPRVTVKSNNGLPVVTNKYLENVDKSWAFQQFIYAIGLGCEIGDEFITSIDQITGGPSFYTYRCHLSRLFQINAAKELKQMWEDLQSGYVFRRLGKTREQSDKLVALLDGPFGMNYL